tara:strand:+ start:437 stop:1105 length:669 start_codon:yes stop_codon:yes gene_type:complete
MAREYKLEIEKRQADVKLKHLRKDGLIPGVYYSHDSNESILFQMQLSELRNAVKSGAAIFQVSVGGNLRNVLFKSVQYHPVTEDVQHIDLYGVDMDAAISIKVPLDIVGECVGVKEDGGVISMPLTELEISCLPSDIPQTITVDITDLRLGQSLQAENLQLDSGLELVTSPDATIASVTHAAVEVEPEVDEDMDATDEDAEDSTESTSDAGDDSQSDSGDSE